jgi:hypothetical protein
MMTQGTDSSKPRASIIQAVNTPLGFFVLVVLIVEVVLGITAGLSEGTDRTFLVRSMVILIFVLVGIVVLLAILRPEALHGQRPLLKSKSEDSTGEGLPLVVHMAIFGKGKRWIEVTDTVRAQVSAGNYKFLVTTALLPSLDDDPCPKIEKDLKVVYSYGGKTHLKITPEYEQLSLP